MHRRGCKGFDRTAHPLAESTASRFDAVLSGTE